MKKGLTTLKRLLSLVMVFAMILTMLPPVPVSAAGATKTVYLKAGVWDQANAWFDAWVWGSSQADAWYTFADDDGDGVYSAEIPADATGMKILRKNPASKTHNWNNWNETGDLTISSTYNCYEITGWSSGKWSTFTYVAPTYTVAGATGLCGSDWNINDAANEMVLNAEGKYEKVFTNVAAGTYEFKVVRNHSWDASWGNGSGNASVSVKTAGSTVTVTFDPATKKVSSAVTEPVVEYTVAFNVTNLTYEGAASVTEGEDYTATLTAAEGYNLPETVTVTGGTASYNKETGVLTVNDITGDITITAEGVLKTYNVTFNGTNVSSNGASTVNHGADYAATLTAAEGYDLPESVTVTVGGEAVTPSYNAATGALTIGAVTGNVVITAEGVKAAPATRTIYLKAGVWDTANAWFDAWVWGSSQADAWYTFVDEDGDGVYSAEIPADATGMKILRKDPASEIHNWNKWNETGDLTIGSTYNCYEITDWSAGKWTTFTYVAPTYTVAGAAGLCGTDWDVANTANDMTQNASGKYEKVFTNVTAGTYQFKVVRNHSWDKSWGDANGPEGNATVTVAVSGSTVTVTFDPATGTVTATVTEPVKKEYTVTFNGTNVTSNGAATVTEGEDYTATLTAAEGYELPETVTVTGGTASYNKETGVLTVTNITGDVTITAVGVEIPVEPETITIYFQNNWMWSDVKVHYWGSANAADTSWPGVAMTKVANDGSYDIYAAEIPADVTGLIINGIKDDGSGSLDQTPNIETGIADGKGWKMNWDNGNQVQDFVYTPAGSEPAEGYYLVGFINGSDYSGNDYKFVDGKLNVTFNSDSYVVIKDASGAWYMTERFVSTGTTSGTFAKGNTEKMQVPANVELSFTLVENADGTLTMSYVVVEEEEPTDGAEYIATFHFANTLNWANVNLYAWIGSGTELNGSWPGTATKVESGYYTATITYKAAEAQDLNFIFNNGSVQTVDLKIPASDFVLDGETYKAEKWVVLTTQTDGKYNAAIVDSPESIVLSPVVDGSSVTFNYGDNGASKVYVAGSFNNWSATANPMTKDENGTWTTTVEGLEAGDYQYKFVVDGNWILDPMNSNIATEADGNQNSVFYILSDETEEDSNTVTINIHYSRTDGKYDNWNLWVWGSAMGGHQVDFTTTDENGAKVATIVLENAREHQSISFKERMSVEGNDWKDQGSMDRTIDLSTVVAGTIDYYIPSGETVYGDDVIRKNKISSVELDYDGNAITVTSVQAIADPEKALKLVKGEEEIEVTITAVGSKYTLTLPEGMELKLSELYLYQVDYYGSLYDIAIDAAYASDKFAAEYTYAGSDLGATWSAGSTTFRVWAPTAEAVSVNLYTSGTKGTEDLIKSVPMTPDVNGTWVVTVDGNLNGTYYTYDVTVNGETVEAVDPYARTTGVNGNRGMVINLDSTDPTGWSSDSNPNYLTSYTDAVIYELHVRDFSIDDSSGMTNKGKYLAFTENNTTTAGGVTTGIDYLADLGITHVHLLPVYDYGSVDETTCSNFNWGYDPVNYNVPEGSYSTNPYSGEVRVNEFKQMVMSLHQHDISVIMDVVYNHVYDADKFCFNNIVPGYFSRPDSNTSGCGNDTASEREMVRKYIVESVLYWCEEYHIDGFRFDLVGLLDVETINQIVSDVHAVRPDVIFYGEGWDMDSTNREPGTEMAKQGNSSQTPGFAYFSDSIRNGIGGSNGNSTGFASGAGNGATIANEWLANPWWTRNPQQVIQYASCHDNYTLVDKLVISTKSGSMTDSIIRMNNLAAVYYMTAQGIPFIHAGEEFLREKLEEGGGRCENSYNASDYVNHIEWSNLEKEQYAANAAYYKGLIAFRAAHPALRYATSADVASYVRNTTTEGKLLVYRVDGCGAGDDDILVIFNANTSAKTVSLPEGEWTVYINGEKAGTTALATATGSVSVAGISAMVLTRKDTGKDEEEPLGASPEKTLYFSNNKGWDKVYAYAWTDNGETILLGAWPGSEMTYVETNDYGEKIYAITLPASETGIEGVIFHNNAGQQTVDIEPGVDGTGYYCTDPDDQGHYQVGTYTYRAPQMGEADEYFLVGYINGVDYTGADYKFEDGKITTTFTADSYVYVINGDNSEEYWTDGYKGAVTSATLKDIHKLSLTADKWDKLLIPGGEEVTITMVKNDNNTITLSYEINNTTAVVDGSGIQAGVTLHCWNWSFAEIEKQIPMIASLGYTAIQTSPVQVMKEATNLATNSVGSHWWVYYQPVDFVITTDDGNALGTKAELESMIATAHEYGVKVIVDVVANHLGNQTGNDLSENIPEYLRNSEYWHDITRNITNWDNREDMTQNCLSGLPDLNTANKEIQGYVLNFLKECIDIGVDGFRFDMAKSIETPKDDASFASDFWPTVIGGAESYASEKYGKDLYMYGEVLDDAKIAISAYTEYMAVTDNGWGNHLRGMIASDNVTVSAGYYKSAPASTLVIWAESHDTFATDDASQSSAGVSELDIHKTWALVAARADVMGLYFARPESMSQALGVASVTGWDNVEVAEVNKFHNAFNGQSEAIGMADGIAYVLRGTTGIVLVNTKGEAVAVNITVEGMADGTYEDQITGNVFTVADGKITGKIGDTGIAVVHNVVKPTKYNVTVSDVTGGTVTADKETAEKGETVTLTVKAADGKVIDTVTVTDEAGSKVELTDNGDGTYTFAQPAGDVTVTVTFKDKAPVAPTKYNVTVSDVTGGTVKANKGTAAAGEIVTLTVEPADGKVIDTVVVTDESGTKVAIIDNGDGTYVFGQPASDVTVTVTFKDEQTTEPNEEHKITVTPSISGKVEVSNETPKAGDTVTVTVTPDEGIEVEKVVVKDASGKGITVTKNADGTYSFVQPDGDVTIEVTYKANYKFTKGDGSSVLQTSGKALSFTVNGDYTKFTGIEVDGKAVDAKNYTVVSGSTVITLKSDYLKTLSAGKHTITVIYSDGQAEGTFYVTVPSDGVTPPTGDNSHVVLWIGMMSISALAVVILLSEKRRRMFKA